MYLTKDQEAILDAIGKAMGNSRIGIEPSRSQLIAKAIGNYIEDSKQDSILRQVIERAEVELTKQSPLATPSRRNVGDVKVM